MAMQKIGFKMKLFPGYADEYKKRHDEIWPNLVLLLKVAGIMDYSIFLDEETHILFGVFEVQELILLEDLPKNAIMQEWWRYMSDIMESNPDHSPVSAPLKEVFYLP
jgi:L-rhamnose mutarotase